jgi:hypothetical protein
MSELSADAKALIESTRLDDAPRVQDKDRIRARIAAQLGAGALAGATLATSRLAEVAPTAVASAAVLANSGKGAGTRVLARADLLRWFAGAAAAGGLAWAAYILAVPLGAPAPVPMPAAPAGAVVEPVAPAPEPVAPATPAVEAPAATIAPASAERAARKPRAKRVSAFRPVGSSASMSAEIALLAQAQKALRVRDGQQALRLAKHHADNFPNGALYEERVGIEAIAHCILGEREHPAVRAFLARAPRSPLGARVRKECGSP